MTTFTVTNVEERADGSPRTYATVMLRVAGAAYDSTGHYIGGASFAMTDAAGNVTIAGLTVGVPYVWTHPNGDSTYFTAGSAGTYTLQAIATGPPGAGPGAITSDVLAAAVAGAMAGGLPLATYGPGGTAGNYGQTQGDARYVISGDAATGVVATDTANLNAKIAAAAGATVRLRAGTYVLDNVTVSGTARLQLDEGAVMQHKAATSNPMFNFTGTFLSIKGGAIDGNRAAQTGRTQIVSGDLASGKTILIDGVRVSNFVRSFVEVSNFGGVIDIQRCTFTGQAEHDGTAGHFTFIAGMGSGQTGAKGLFRFNHNQAYGTITPAVSGGSPGGILLSPNTGGGADTIGNYSTVEAIGNYFWGYGQNAGGNDIAPIHFYNGTDGARVIGNRFEQCAFTAIDGKSVRNFVCTGNVILNGITSDAFAQAEGAIDYAPFYHSPTFPNPRAVISNNIIASPGVTTAGVKLVGIAVHGGAGFPAKDVVLGNNNVSGCGIGIYADYPENMVINGGIIQGATGGTSGTEQGIQINHPTGTISIGGGIQVYSRNGSGLFASGNGTAAQFLIGDSYWEHSAVGWYSMLIGGGALFKLTGATFNNVGSATGPKFTADASSNKIARLAWDESNTYIGTALPTFDWPNITLASGHLRGTGSPAGVVPASGVGVQYRQTDGTGTGILWVATASGTGSWSQIMSGTQSVGWGPADNLYLGATESPNYISATAGPMVSGTPWVFKVKMPTGGTVGKVRCVVGGAVGTPTAGQCLIGVYNSAGTLIGNSADQGSAWGSTGAKSATITVVGGQSLAVTAGDYVWVKFLCVATTPISLKGSTATGGAGNDNLGATAYRYAAGTASQTTLASTLETLVPLSGSPNPGPYQPWCAVTA